MDTAKGLSDNLINLLSAADKRHGFPEGTMHSVMQQESGGQDRFINYPSTYHYEANKDGKRIAGHTNKVSTAFGPFGILESTGAKPGYGVTPLMNKSLDEQVRFASDYLAARSKGSGGLAGGLAGYGEGAKYSQQVLGRISSTPIKRTANAAPVVAPVQQQQPVPVGEVVSVQVEPPPPQALAVQTQLNAPNPWDQFNQAMFKDREVTAAELVANEAPQPQKIAQVGVPDFMETMNKALPVRSNAPAIRAFNAWGLRGARA